MKGFIEVPTVKDELALIALSAIVQIRPGRRMPNTMTIELIAPSGEGHDQVTTNLTYDEIKALIKQAS